MNTTTFLASGALLLAAGLSNVAAQGTGTTTQPYPPHATPTTTSATAHTAPMTPARASEIIGKEIIDAGGKEIAEIKDLVVCDSGEVIAIIETKTRDDAMVGVPLCHLEARLDESQREAKAKDKEENVSAGSPTPDIEAFALLGDRTLLDSAPVLKDEKALDGMWVKSSQEHFGVAKEATKPAGERKEAEKAVVPTTKPTCVKHLIGENVKGSDGDGIGDVKDFAIDLRTSEVAYAIVSTGGVLGMGDSLHAIPFERLTISEDVVTVPMNKDSVSKLPKLDLDRLPNSSTTMVVPERSSVATDGNPDRGTDR